MNRRHFLSLLADAASAVVLGGALAFGREREAGDVVAEAGCPPLTETWVHGYDEDRVEIWRVKIDGESALRRSVSLPAPAAFVQVSHTVVGTGAFSIPTVTLDA